MMIPLLKIDPWAPGTGEFDEIWLHQQISTGCAWIPICQMRLRDAKLIVAVFNAARNFQEAMKDVIK